MIKKLIREYKSKKIIKRSGMFDIKYYLFTYPDIRHADIDPIKHYVKYGVQEGRNPNRLFDTTFYIHKYEDVQSSGLNPFVHWLLHGQSEGRVTKEIEIVQLQEAIEADTFYKERPYESWRRINLQANRANLESFCSSEALYTQRFKKHIQNKEFVSFDIFDTLVERTFIDPHSVFEYLQSIARQERDIDFDFATMRIDAERQTRKESKRQEITFDEIYETLMYQSAFSKELCAYLKAKELEIEKHVLRTKAFGRELLAMAQQANKSIIFISDMYLPKSFVVEVLLGLGFSIKSEDIYLSSDERVTKHHGKLFRQIAQERGIDKSQWLHVGDNLHSDIHIPSTLGIESFYLRNASLALKKHYDQVGIDNTHQTLQASSIYGTLAHHLYSANQASMASFYNQEPYRIGYEALGVAFLGFLNYLQRVVKTNRYQKLFFVSRDGCYLQKIYDSLRTIDTSLPPSHYMLSSRAMMYSASMLNSSTISYIANKDYFPTTLKHLLNVRFNFDEAMFKASQSMLKTFEFESFEDEVRQERNHQNYHDFVLSQSALIIDNNAHHQEQFLEYIDEIGLDEASLIVDIGYAGSLQKSLLSLKNQRIDALYFVTNAKIEELSEDRLKHYAYIPHRDELSRSFFDYVQLFELLFSATHPSIVALDKQEGQWKPQFDNNAFSAKTNQVLASIHQGAIAFVEDYLVHHYELFAMSSFSPKLALQNLLSLFENPSVEDAKLFDEVIFEDNFGAHKYALISSDLERLKLSDANLLRQGVWAQASKKLLQAKEYRAVENPEPSHEFSDQLLGSLEVIASYEQSAYKSSMPKSTKSNYLMLIIKVDAQYAEPMMASLSKQHYPYFSALFIFEEEIDAHLKASIVGSEVFDYAITSLRAELFANEEWIVLVTNAMSFEPNFLVEINRAVDQKEADIIYMDEDDCIDGKYDNPQFKPDFSPELMLSQPYYMGGAIVANAVSLGEFSTEFSIEKIIFDAMLKEQKIYHLAKVLYHNLEPQERKNYQALIEEYLDSKAIGYDRVYEEEFSQSSNRSIYSIEFSNSGPDIAIIIPTKNMFSVLKVALDSLEMTSYQNYRVYIINNDSDEADILSYFATTKHTVLKISSPNGIFSYSYVNNEAAKRVDEEYVLFLNNDVKVITPQWLSQMIGLMQIERVGSVGARLYYGNDRLQHVGITNHVAPYGLPAPSFKLINGNSSGYLDYAKSIKNFSAMSAACMLTTKEIFFEMGGFDDEDFSVAYNDCDYGFKLTKAGYRNVVAPNAQLYHYEGVTRGIGVGNDKPSEEAAFVRKYKNWQDPYYNPNLTSMGTDFAMRSTMVRTTPDYKFKVLMVSHNYEYEGASLILFEIAKALKHNSMIEPVILSLEDGPLREAYEAQGIEAHYLEGFAIFFAPTLEVYNEQLFQVEKMIVTLGIHVVFANTMLCYWAVEAANELNIPTLWLIHESEPPFEHLREHSSFVEERGKASVTYAYKTIFVAQSTRELFEPYNFKNNFEVIYNGFDTSRVSIAMDDQMRRDMRQKLGIEDKFVFICPGIVSPRKAQMDAIKAFEALPSDVQKQIVILIVGDRASQYSTTLHEYHNKSEKIVQKNIHIIGETKSIGDYYNAADAFLFTSHLESFPKVIQEAMYLKLPIVSTNTFGIKEQVFDNSSALLCDVGDVNALSNNMQRLYEDEALRKKLSQNATSALEKLPTYEEMVEAYHELLQQAYLLGKGGV